MPQGIGRHLIVIRIFSRTTSHPLILRRHHVDPVDEGGVAPVVELAPGLGELHGVVRRYCFEHRPQSVPADGDGVAEEVALQQLATIELSHSRKASGLRSDNLSVDDLATSD